MNQKEWAKSVQWIGIVAGCVIYKEGKYLLVQEKQDKVYGLWSIPAGFVNSGEEVEHAAIREAKEESGFDVEIDGLIDLYHDATNEPIKHAYRAQIVGGSLKIQEDEILDARWLTYDEIKKLNKDGKIRSRWIFNAITRVNQSL